MKGNISVEELILELRGGNLTEAAFYSALIIILAYMSSMIPPEVRGFQFIRPPHQEWMYGSKKPPHQFGYGKKHGPRSLEVNAGSERKHPLNGSWNYIDVMRELHKQSKKRMVEIQIADQMYTI